MKLKFRAWATIGLMLGLMLLVSMPALAAKTPQEAVSEMTWGVNLSTLYMSGGYTDAAVDWDPNATKHLGYVSNAPMGLGVSFWDGSFDWLAYKHIHENTFEASIELPYYDGSVVQGNWFDGLFDISVFLDETGGDACTLRLSNSRLELSSGATEYLPAMDGEYTMNNFYPDPGGTDHVCAMNVSQRLSLSPGSRYSSAVLKTTVTQVSIPFTETGKVDCLYQFGREKIDQYELTDAFMDQGANTFRLPVSWTAFVDDETFEIDPEWLEAVKTEVDYILSRGGYCILNLHEDYLGSSFVGDHWEKDWTNAQYSDYVNARFRRIWEQVADSFRDYPDNLIFETANEPVSGSYSGANRQVQIDMVNDMNNTFVEIVRESGGNNAERLLCLVTPDYNRPEGLDTLDIPDDDYLILTVHSYQEIEFTWSGQPANPGWDYETPTDAYFEKLATFIQQTGIPVIIGETGVSQKETSAVRAERAAYFFGKCHEAGIPALWWEDYFEAEDHSQYWLYDIKNERWGDIGVVEAIKQAIQIDTGTALDAPVIELESSIVPPGEGAEAAVWVTYTDPDAEATRAYVVASDNRTHMGYYEITERDGRRGIWVPVEEFPLGTYKLTVFSTAQGRMPGYASVRFDVAVPLPDFEFTVDRTEILTYDTLTLRFAAADASNLQVYITCEDISYYNDFRYTDGQQGEWTWNPGNMMGTFTLTPCAQYKRQDEQGQNYTETREEPDAAITVTVTADGKLDAVRLSGVPSALELGDGIEGMFEPVEGATSYDVQLQYCPDEWHWIDGYSVRPEDEGYTSLSYGADSFKNLGRYQLMVTANAPHKASGQTYMYIFVMEALDHEGISLTLEGEGGEVDWPAQQLCPVRVSAPGATAVRLLRWFGGWDYRRGADLDENGEVVFCLREDGGDFPMIAQASYDEGYSWEGIDYWSYDWDNSGLNWTKTSDQLTIHMVAEGDTDAPEVSIPQTVRRGQLLNITVSSLGEEQSPSRGRRGLAYITDNAENWQCDSVECTDPELPFTASMPTSNLEPGIWYARFEASTPGYNTYRVRQAFEVVDPDSDLVFELPEQLYDRKEFTISAFAEGAAWIDLTVKDLNNNMEIVHEQRYDGDHINEMHFRFGAGDYEFSAVAHFVDECGNELPDTVSRSLTRSVAYLGALEEPVIRLPEVIPVEQDMEFSVDGLAQVAQGGYWHVRVIDPDQQGDNGEPEELFIRRIDDYAETPESFTLPGELLTSGRRLCVDVWIDMDGYPGRGAGTTIVAGAVWPVVVPEFEFTVDRAEMLTHDNCTMRFSAAGADHLQVHITREGDPYYNDYRDADGEQADWTWGPGSMTGTFTLTPCARYTRQDENGEDCTEEREESERALTVTVTAEGTLDAVRLIDIPAALQLGSGIEGAFEPVEGAEWYDIQLEYCPDDWFWIDGYTVRPEDDDFTTGLSYGADCFESLGRYRLMVTANAVHKASSQSSRYIYAVEEMDGEGISLTVEGQGGYVAWPATQLCPVRISAPGATAVRVLTWYGDCNYWRGADLDEDGGTTYWLRNDSGVYPLVVQAAYDEGYDWEGIETWSYDWGNSGLHWSKTGAELTLEMLAEGVTDAPEVSIPRTVRRGELLNVTVNSLGDEQSPSRGSFVMAFITDDGDDWQCESVECTDPALPFTASMPTANLEPGIWYAKMDVSTPGYDTYRLHQAFEVLAPEESCVLELPERLYDRKDFTVSAYAGGAAWIDLIVKDRNNSMETVHEQRYEGDRIGDMHFRIGAGDYEFRAVAHYVDEDGNELSDTAASQAVARSVAYLGSLEEPAVHLPDFIPALRDLSFTVDGLAQVADGYWHVRILDPDHRNDDGEPEELIIWTVTDDQRVMESFTVPGELLNDGRRLGINIWIDMDGYPGRGVDMDFTVGATDSALWLPAGLLRIDEEAFLGIPAVSVRIPQGAQAIGSRAFAGCDALRAVWIPDSVTEIAGDAFSGAGDCTIYAPAGSAAETYAGRHGMDFRAVEP